MKKYKKRSQMGEIVHRLARSKSAMAGFIILAFLILIALGSLFMSYDSIAKSNVSMQFSSSSWKYPFGTDNMGRNAFLRVLYGSRYSLVIGFSAVMFSAIVGVTLGSIAAYYGGKTENIIMRASDVLASLPGLLLGMVIMVMLGRKMQNLIIAVGVAGIPHFIRMSRASILTVKGNEYVEAARATGFSDLRIIATQVLPNGLSPIIVQVTALIGLNIIFAASLSFLGFGIPPPIPEWGALVSAGREYIRTAPWLMTYPGLFIMITVLGFNLLGDGLRDALDPKLKK
jgi:peptide/nickel transport system permease protein